MHNSKKISINDISVFYSNTFSYSPSTDNFLENSPPQTKENNLTLIICIVIAAFVIDRDLKSENILIDEKKIY